MGDSSIYHISTCNNSLTLRITVLPFPPSERTIPSTVPCSVQYRDGGMEGCVDMWGGVRCRSEGGDGWDGV